jgi:glyoxylase-like metal-dependent hydrolase (beta-lactamase superfamily II)
MLPDSIITDIFSSYEELAIHVHLYLIRAEKTVLIDTGTKYSPQADILPVLQRYGLDFSNIDYILNTHGHIDHIGGNAAIKKAGGAKILIHSDDATAVEDHKKFFRNFFGPAVEGIWGKELVDEEWARYSSLYSGEIAIDHSLKDNDIIDLGKECSLRVIHVPGHSLGSVAFYWEKEGIIFSGDSMQGLLDDTGALPILIDLQLYMKSIKRLLDLPVRVLMQSHDHRGIATPPSHIKRNGEVKQYLLDCYEAAERINEALASSLSDSADKTVRQIYDEVVAKLPAAYKFKPIIQLGILPLFSGFTVYFPLMAQKNNLYTKYQ